MSLNTDQEINSLEYVNDEQIDLLNKCEELRKSGGADAVNKYIETLDEDDSLDLYGDLGLTENWCTHCSTGAPVMQNLVFTEIQFCLLCGKHIESPHPTWEEFVTKYKPLAANNGDPDEGQDDYEATCVMDDYHIEPQNSIIKNCPPNRLWTCMDNDYGTPIVVAGWHYINRIGYIITEIPWTDAEETYQY